MGLYVVAVVVLLIFIKLLCHFTLAENYKASMQTGSAESGTSPERARLEVTDLVRPLVLYMQYTLIIFSLPLELPQFLARSIQALSWLWAPASPEAFNIECLVDKEHGPVPYAVAKVLFYLCMPIAMLMALLTAEVAVRQVPKCCKQRGGSPLNIPMYRTTSSNTPKSYVDRLGSATVVVLFFFFPSIVRTLFGLFACVPIDDAVSPPFEAAAIGWFWLQDLNQQCFAGFHKTWALGLGVPLLIIVCLMLPGSILWLTLRNKSKLTGPHFVKHYGFLVRAYKPSCCFFEAVVLVQTMLLVAVSVFGLTLGAYRQGLLLNGVLGYMVLMQFVLRPHTKKQAARIVLHSYMCLFLTSYTALSFLRGSTGTFSTDPTVAAYMGAFVLVLNITFVISVLWQLVQLIEWADIKTKAQLLGEWVGRTGKNVRRRVSGGVLPKKSGGLQMSGMGTRN